MLLIFTDLDGTLLDSDTYHYEFALPVLEELHRRSIPVIPVTSKTRQEVQLLRRAIAPDDPFIVENGSGVFISAEDTRFSFPQWLQAASELHTIQLGCTYSEVRYALRLLEEKLGVSLTGFGDMHVEDIVRHTGLSTEAATQAKSREFSEPFITPHSISIDRIEQSAQELGFRVVVGDRFCHLLGEHAGKGKAAQLLIQAHQQAHPRTPVHTLGLGNSPNDRELLAVMDTAIIIPSDTGPHPELANMGWHVASNPGCIGWADSVAEWCDRLSYGQAV
jgi:mannosyl-3-phosphoglycerate phosphatase